MTARSPALRHSLFRFPGLLLALALAVAPPTPAHGQNHALLLGGEELARMAQAARIAAHGDGRKFFTSGDRVYATGLAADATPGQSYRIYRNPQPITGPVGTLPGHEAQFLGRAVFRVGTPALAAFDIVDAQREIQAGDLLLPE